MKPMDKKVIGHIGEEAVSNHLKRKGFGSYPLTTGTLFAKIEILARKLAIVYHEIHNKRPKK